MHEARADSVPGRAERAVMALVGGMDMASKIVKSARLHHLDVRSFDRAERLLNAVLARTPEVLILDFETREAEAFKFLKALRENAVDNAVIRKAAVVGWVSNSKRDVKNEAERAGCLRVFLKTEFLSGLDEIWLRYAK